MALVGIDVSCRRCSKLFFVCRACWRGQAYCSNECRREGALAMRREAGRRYQASVAGRERHRARQRAFRRRHGASPRVTHQGTQPAVVQVRARTSRTGAPLAIIAGRAPVPCCMICGRAVALLPRSSTHRSIRRLERGRRRDYS